MIQNGSTTQHKLLIMHINRNAFYIKDIVRSSIGPMIFALKK